MWCFCFVIKARRTLESASSLDSIQTWRAAPQRWLTSFSVAWCGEGAPCRRAVSQCAFRLSLQALERRFDIACGGMRFLHSFQRRLVLVGSSPSHVVIDHYVTVRTTLLIAIRDQTFGVCTSIAQMMPFLWFCAYVNKGRNGRSIYLQWLMVKIYISSDRQNFVVSWWRKVTRGSWRKHFLKCLNIFLFFYFFILYISIFLIGSFHHLLFCLFVLRTYFYFWYW